MLLFIMQAILLTFRKYYRYNTYVNNYLTSEAEIHLTFKNILLLIDTLDTLNF